MNVLPGILLLTGMSLLTSTEGSGVKYAGAIYYPRPAATDVTRSIPLKAVATKLEIRGLSVGIKANLTYENSASHDVDCHFLFPLSKDAAIYYLEAIIGGRQLIAKVEERAVAERKYREAVESGKQAVLLENEHIGYDIFRLSLGNLPAHGTAFIMLGYVQPIDDLDSSGLISVTLPMVLNPRLKVRGMAPDPSSFIGSGGYMAVTDTDYRMTLEAKVELGMGRKIVEIYSGNRKDLLQVSYKRRRTIAHVALLGEFEKDHDLQIIIRPKKSMEPLVFMEPRAEMPRNNWLSHDVVAAWILPPTPHLERALPASQFEIWILLDRSGSMAGDKIENAKRALKTLVSKLPDGCHFNIIGFGGSYVSLADRGETLVMNKEKRDLAQNHLDTSSADLGESNILLPLQVIYRAPRSVDGVRFILIMTDGQTFQIDDAIELAKNNTETRIFSIGIGYGAPTELVKGLAHATGGLSASVSDGASILEETVLKMLKAMISTPLKSARLDWSVKSGGIINRLVPESLPNISHGSKPLFQFAVIQHFWGRDVNGSVAPNIGVDDTLPLHRLAAQRLLTALERNLSDDAVSSAIAVSKTTGVLCKFTSMVAVEVKTDEIVQPDVFYKIETYHALPDAFVTFRASPASPLLITRRPTTTVVFEESANFSVFGLLTITPMIIAAIIMVIGIIVVVALACSC